MMRLVLEHGLSGQLDLVSILADTLDHYLLAFLQFIANILDSAVSDFRNMQKPVGAWEYLNKRPQIDDSGYSAEIVLANFSLCPQSSDPVNGCLRSPPVRTFDLNRSLII